MRRDQLISDSAITASIARAVIIYEELKGMPRNPLIRHHDAHTQKLFSYRTQTKTVS